MKHSYACAECIVKTICTELCEDVIEFIYNTKILNFITENKCCPDCGGLRLVTCGGETLKDNRVFVDSSAICLECSSLFFKHESIIGRYRKHIRILRKNDKVITFWEYLHDNNFISGKVFTYGKV